MAPDAPLAAGPESEASSSRAPYGRLLCLPPVIRAQELSATLSGLVTDSTGAVIPNATVTITLNGVTGASRVVLSDGTGFYKATNLTNGTYTVSVVATGFETFNGKNVVLDVAEKHSLNVQMKTGSVSTTVTVEDNPVSIDTESSAQAGTISGEQVRELELSSRSFEQLVTLQPGVVNETRRRCFRGRNSACSQRSSHHGEQLDG